MSEKKKRISIFANLLMDVAASIAIKVSKCLPSPAVFYLPSSG